MYIYMYIYTYICIHLYVYTWHSIHNLRHGIHSSWLLYIVRDTYIVFVSYTWFDVDGAWLRGGGGGMQEERRRLKRGDSSPLQMSEGGRLMIYIYIYIYIYMTRMQTSWLMYIVCVSCFLTSLWLICIVGVMYTWFMNKGERRACKKMKGATVDDVYAKFVTHVHSLCLMLHNRLILISNFPY